MLIYYMWSLILSSMAIPSLDRGITKLCNIALLNVGSWFIIAYVDFALLINLDSAYVCSPRSN